MLRQLMLYGGVCLTSYGVSQFQLAAPPKNWPRDANFPFLFCFNNGPVLFSFSLARQLYFLSSFLSGSCRVGTGTAPGFMVLWYEKRVLTWLHVCTSIRCAPPFCSCSMGRGHVFRPFLCTFKVFRTEEGHVKQRDSGPHFFLLRRPLQMPPVSAMRSCRSDHQ